MKNGFDQIAPVYDKLSRLVFGKAIEEAQIRMLDHLPKGGNWLLLGGGTGWILPHIFAICQPDSLHYLESSEAMMERAQRRLADDQQNIIWRLGTEKDLAEEEKFTVIFTPFYLDLFSAAELQKVLGQLRKNLEEDGHWLLCDFRIAGGWWAPLSRLLVWGMYRFFRLCCGISGSQLADFEMLISSKGFRLLKRKIYFHGMIASCLYLKE